MGPVLSDDIYHLICDQLWYARDFNTLYNCVLSGRRLAAPALANLYRMHDVAPVTSRGSDEVEVARQARGVDVRPTYEDQQFKWVKLWRALILSSLGMTAYAYCYYVRALSLSDLRQLLEDMNVRNSSAFFNGELSKFRIATDTPMKLTRKSTRQPRLNYSAILDAVGEVITKHTPLLEELSGDRISSASLLTWIPRLPRLQRLGLWSGASLANGAGKVVRDHCRSFRILEFYEWSDPEADKLMAAFITDLRPQSLESLEIFSHSDVGAETFIAMTNHSDTLVKLAISIKSDAMPALPQLKNCSSLVSLELLEIGGTTDLEKTQNDVFLEVVSWLKNCKSLRNITLKNMISASAILTPVLTENDIRLERLELEGYLPNSARDFHQALSLQETLRSVSLKSGTDEDFAGEEVDNFVRCLSKLRHLTELRLKDVSDYFRDDSIRALALNLPELEEWFTGGYGITDAIWQDIAQLRNLRRLEISAWTSFTIDGLLDYISKLGPGNNRLILNVMMADPESSLSLEEQTLVREALAAQVEGRFDYILARDPDISEYNGSDSD